MKQLLEFLKTTVLGGLFVLLPLLLLYLLLSEALGLIASGMRHADAAKKVNISQSALKARLTAARTKLLARTTAEAIQRAKDYRML